VRREQDNASFRYHLAMAQSRSGRDKEALANFQSALRINPHIPEAGDIRNEMTTLLKNGAGR